MAKTLTNSKRVTFDLPPELLAQLQQIALSDRRSLSAVLRIAAEQLVAAQILK